MIAQDTHWRLTPMIGSTNSQFVKSRELSIWTIDLAEKSTLEWETGFWRMKGLCSWIAAT